MGTIFRAATNEKGRTGEVRPFLPFLGECPHFRFFYSRGTSNNATMLMILINGLIAGPAVSL
jgi:hypothetical protein